ncbi:MAG: hypothetical protein BGN88_00250 [Clostridiales bacterium 43-6]|nr:MAG: hypothetical protein BGN88_00250 [Clostridiales bacterium 43-6]
MALNIRTVQPKDAKALREIYAPYVETTWVTFETEVPDVEEIRRRVETYHFQLGFPYYVAEQGGETVGYAYAHPFHERAAFRYTAETSVYVKQGFEGSGIGTKLYQVVLNDLKQSGFHKVIAILGYPNEASKRFHEKLGFRETGVLHEVGYKFDCWLDAGYFEKVL